MVSATADKTHLLNNLQSLRALAACLVLYHHYIGYPQIRIDDWYGSVGVDIFFVISGFVITYAKRGRPVDFIIRRIIRIAPLYWLLTLAWVALSLLFRVSGSGLTPDSITLPLVLKSLLFIPDQPIITRGWTLNYEMYFYGLFAISMTINKRAAALICVGFITVIYMTINFAFLGRPLNFYGSAHVFEFAMGSLIFYIWKGIGKSEFLVRALIRARYALVAAVGMLLIACCISSNIYRDHSLIAVTIFSGLFVLFSVTAEEYCGISVNSKILNLLGNASYSIYLVHRFIYAPMSRIIFPYLENQEIWIKLIAFAPIALIVISGSVAVHIVIERPMTRILGELWRKCGAPKEAAIVNVVEWNVVSSEGTSSEARARGGADQSVKL